MLDVGVDKHVIEFGVSLLPCFLNNTVTRENFEVDAHGGTKSRECGAYRGHARRIPEALKWLSQHKRAHSEYALQMRPRCKSAEGEVLHKRVEYICRILFKPRGK